MKKKAQQKKRHEQDAGIVMYTVLSVCVNISCCAAVLTLDTMMRITYSAATISLQYGQININT